MNDVILPKRPYISWEKAHGAVAENMLWRLIKLLFLLAILAFAGLVAYAYVGPYFGVDFSAPQSEVREPVTLDAQ